MTKKFYNKTKKFVDNPLQIRYNKRVVKIAGVAEWQTRMFKGHVRKSVGSSPTTCTKEKTALLLQF